MSTFANLSPAERDERVLVILRASGGSHDFTDSPFEFEFRAAGKAMRSRLSIKGKVIALKGRGK